jgi:hypothetical protein
MISSINTNILLTILSFSLLGESQAQLFPKQNIEVVIDSELLANAWLGGLDLPQFSGGDINLDGIEDLFIFDRKSNKILVLLKDIDGKYSYAPDLEKFFPEIIRFALFRDYNCDGLMDIFAFVSGGIKVYRQEVVAGEISFVVASNLLKFDLAGFQVNIYNSNIDMPGIEDIDGDGDQDIVVFSILGGSLPLFRNLSVESGFGCDSLIYEEFTACWGQFSESLANNTINFDISCKGSTQGQVPSGGPKHAGSTILLFDPNEDDKMDILIGDISYNTLIFLENDATSLNAHMTEPLTDFSYPSYDLPIDLEIFPVGFYVDVTNDGKKDLIISPNSSTAHLNITSSWLYENTGNTSTPFSFVKNNFIIDETIDVGSYSYPTFFDQNGDGLLDMILANGYVYENMGTTVGSLYYFENTGNDTVPEFTLVDDDYLNLRNFGVDFMRPTYGDLDNDGDSDLIFGDENGLLHYYENTAGVGISATFIQNELNYFNIDVGNLAHPQLIDVNQDGLLDLLIGREGSFGEIAYYWNHGSASIPIFSADSSNQAFGKIRTNSPGFIPGYSAPTLLQTDSNQIIYVGSEMGFIASYLLNTDSLKTGSFNMIAPGTFPSRVGLRTNVSIVDLDNDNVLDFFVGNARGGVSYFSGTPPLDTIIIDTTGINIKERLNEGLAFQLFPNPSSNFLQLRLSGSEVDFNISIYDMLGKQIWTAYAQKTTELIIDISSFNKGLYFFKIYNDEGMFNVKTFLKE